MSAIIEKAVQIGGMVANIQGYTGDPYFEQIQHYVNAHGPLYAVGSVACPLNGVILDIGANIGATGTMLSYIIPQGRLICVEPSPRNAALLRRNLAENVRIEHQVVPMAIGAAEGTVQFHESGICGAWNHVTPETRIGLGDPTTTVDVVTVDGLVERLGLERLDLIKVDVEGYEGEVLKGMRRTVERLSPVVQIEINSAASIIIADRSPRDLLRDFIGLMGNVYAYGEAGRLAPLDTDAARSAFLHRNITQHGGIDDVVGCRDPERLRALIA